MATKRKKKLENVTKQLPTNHWKHQVHSAKLLKIPKALELWRVDNLDAHCMDLNVPVYSIVEHLVVARHGGKSCLTFALLLECECLARA